MSEHFEFVYRFPISFSMKRHSDLVVMISVGTIELAALANTSIVLALGLFPSSCRARFADATNEHNFDVIQPT